MAKIQDGGFHPPIPPTHIHPESRENTTAGKAPPAAPSRAAEFPDKVEEHSGQTSILDHAPAAGPPGQDAAGKAAADTPELSEDMTARLKMARLNPTVRSETSTAAERIVRELKSRPAPARLEQLGQRALTHFAKASGAGQAEMQAHQRVLEAARNQWDNRIQTEQTGGGDTPGEMDAAVFSELTAHFSSAPGADPMVALFGVMKETMEGVNRDKQYALEKLASMNETAAAMGEYLQELQDQSDALQAATGDEASEDKVDVDARFPRPPGPDDVLQISRLGPKERVAMDAVERDAHRGEIERLRDELDDISQMLQLKLQDSTQNYQQDRQSISNILKALCDTSRSLLQNMK